MVTEEDIKRVVRGPADLEERIEQLLKQKELLKTACKKAGARIKELERDREVLKKEIDRLSEYNQNLEIMMKGK
jgi:chromosome segregation ATPase